MPIHLHGYKGCVSAWVGEQVECVRGDLNHWTAKLHASKYDSFHFIMENVEKIGI